jgi:hypothetical protein
LPPQSKLPFEFGDLLIALKQLLPEFFVLTVQTFKFAFQPALIRLVIRPVR